MSATAERVRELGERIARAAGSVLPRGAGTKPGLSAAPAAEPLDVSGLRGVVAYEPSELIVTALAGTPIAELERELAANGQRLGFDPPFADAGATLGGALASGLAGPAAHRHGGPRDALLAVAFLDGRGRELRAGARVVKNAAGFDLPKLLAGSLGRLGLVTEATVKVLPAPAAWATVRATHATLADALAALARLAVAPLELEAVELLPPGALLLRIGGPPEGLARRAARLAQAAGGATELLEGEQEAALWRAARELAWAPPGGALVKLPVTPARLAALDARLAAGGAARRYGRGGHLAWVAWEGDLPADLPALLAELDLRALVVRGGAGPLLGPARGAAFARRVRAVLDPDRRFPQD